MIPPSLVSFVWGSKVFKFDWTYIFYLDNNIIILENIIILTHTAEPL